MELPAMPSTPAAPDDQTAWVDEREREMLLRLADGWSNVEIAESMDLAPDTVKSALTVIRRKLAARNRAHVVAEAYRRGLL